METHPQRVVTPAEVTISGASVVPVKVKENEVPLPVDIHVGKRIRHRRWMIGMSQQDLAQKVGIKFQQIQKYETGANRVSASRLWDIAEALQIGIQFFFDGLDAAAETDESHLMNGESLQLIAAWYAVPEIQRRHLLELARSMRATG